MRKISLCFALLLIAACLSGCSQRPAPENGRVRQIVIHSDLLDRDIISHVCLPVGYRETARYPVLYYFASGGGSSFTTINQFHIAETADLLTRDQRIEPMIIVALGIEFSFGMNSSDVPGEATFTSESSYTFREGRYEDYIIQEAIPYIDAHYPTLADREHRFIGGYSMGGFAALHLAFRNPGLFSKVGGHSPTLFEDTYITPEIHAWLFPDEAAREARDPLRLAKSQDLSGLSVYLDTGFADVNAAACEALSRILAERHVAVSFQLLRGEHGFAYCAEHMPEYLMFYGLKPLAEGEALPEAL